MEGWGGRASKEKSSKEHAILNPEAIRCNVNPLPPSFTAPPGKRFEAWQWEMRREPTAPSALVGYGSTNIKMSSMSTQAGLDGVKEGKYKRQSPQWPYAIHPSILLAAALTEADEAIGMQAAH